MQLDGKLPKPWTLVSNATYSCVAFPAARLAVPGLPSKTEVQGFLVPGMCKIPLSEGRIKVGGIANNRLCKFVHRVRN